MGSKGITLLLVLAIILTVVVLANAALVFIKNQARITKNQVERIQHYYAAQGGIVLALEQLRTGNWTPDASDDNYYCINGPIDVDEPGVDCDCDAVPPVDCVSDEDFPNVQIRVYSLNSGYADEVVDSTGTRRIEAKVVY